MESRDFQSPASACRQDELTHFKLLSSLSSDLIWGGCCSTVLILVDIEDLAEKSVTIFSASQIFLLVISTSLQLGSQGIHKGVCHPSKGIIQHSGMCCTIICPEQHYRKGIHQLTPSSAFSSEGCVADDES